MMTKEEYHSLRPKDTFGPYEGINWIVDKSSEEDGVVWASGIFADFIGGSVPVTYNPDWPDWITNNILTRNVLIIEKEW
jgi:hypothetical protein